MSITYYNLYLCPLHGEEEEEEEEEEGERRRGGADVSGGLSSIPQVVYIHSLIVAADPVEGINRILNSIFQDILKMNYQNVRENVLSCIIIDIHDFLQMDGIINKKIIKKKTGDKVIGISDRYLKSREKNNIIDLKNYFKILGLERYIGVSCRGFNGTGIQIPISLLKSNVCSILDKL